MKYLDQAQNGLLQRTDSCIFFAVSPCGFDLFTTESTPRIVREEDKIEAKRNGTISREFADAVIAKFGPFPMELTTLVGHENYQYKI